MSGTTDTLDRSAWSLEAMRGKQFYLTKSNNGRCPPYMFCDNSDMYTIRNIVTTFDKPNNKFRTPSDEDQDKLKAKMEVSVPIGSALYNWAEGNDKFHRSMFQTREFIESRPNGVQLIPMNVCRARYPNAELEVKKEFVSSRYTARDARYFYSVDDLSNRQLASVDLTDDEAVRIDGGESQRDVLGERTSILMDPKFLTNTQIREFQLTEHEQTEFNDMVAADAHQRLVNDYRLSLFRKAINSKLDATHIKESFKQFVDVPEGEWQLLSMQKALGDGESEKLEKEVEMYGFKHVTSWKVKYSPAIREGYIDKDGRQYDPTLRISVYPVGMKDRAAEKCTQIIIGNVVDDSGVFDVDRDADDVPINKGTHHIRKMDQALFRLQQSGIQFHGQGLDCVSAIKANNIYLVRDERHLNAEAPSAFARPAKRKQQSEESAPTKRAHIEQAVESTPPPTHDADAFD